MFQGDMAKPWKFREVLPQNRACSCCSHGFSNARGLVGTCIHHHVEQVWPLSPCIGRSTPPSCPCMHTWCNCGGNGAASWHAWAREHVSLMEVGGGYVPSCVGAFPHAMSSKPCHLCHHHIPDACSSTAQHSSMHGIQHSVKGDAHVDEMAKLLKLFECHQKCFGGVS